MLIANLVTPQVEEANARPYLNKNPALGIPDTIALSKVPVHCPTS